MGMGPVPASRKALERAGWKAADLDLFELNEAFAAGLRREQGMGWDPAKVNVNGGAIAIGHPIGAIGLPHPGHAAARDAAPRRQEGHRRAVHRRRHGRFPAVERAESGSNSNDKSTEKTMSNKK
jgi:acetyl-CoA acetyltransferase